LEAFGRNWKLLEAFGRNWKELEAPGSIWKNLEAPGRISWLEENDRPADESVLFRTF
jgi:hypothetical protein